MEKGTKNTLIAIGSGLAVGAILGVLFAPNKGIDTRRKITEAKDKLAEKFKEQVEKSKESLLSLKEGIKERLEAVNEKVEELV
jgi:gas vesicle protein